MNKIIAGLISAVALIAIGSSPAWAQSTPATASAGVSFSTTLQVSKTTDLQLGSWLSAANQSAFGVNTAGVAVGNGQITSTRTAATFTATGGANSNILWTFPASIIATSGSNSVTITPVLPAGATGSTLAANLGAQGSSTVSMGGTITTGATAPTPGSYTGSFTVSAAYN